ncbi:DUF3986 family protein [Brevibacillus porteri]|uniref:DUF3986 family protein n=1 Tax=Brevibacillus porteri TaxID=2126350 RepID=UPI003634952E
MLDWNKMEENYVTDHHFHVSYHEDGYDLEGTVWKRKSGNGWDVLFSDVHNDLNEENDTQLDLIIFRYEKDQLDTEEINEMFAQWVNKVLLRNAKDKSVYMYKET